MIIFATSLCLLFSISAYASEATPRSETITQEQKARARQELYAAIQKGNLEETGNSEEILLALKHGADIYGPITIKGTRNKRQMNALNYAVKYYIKHNGEKDDDALLKAMLQGMTTADLERIVDYADDINYSDENKELESHSAITPRYLFNKNLTTKFSSIEEFLGPYVKRSHFNSDQDEVDHGKNNYSYLSGLSSGGWWPYAD